MSSTRAHTNNQPQGTSTLQSIANLLSYVLHPVFMPLLITFVMYKLAPASFAGYTQKQIGLWFASIGFTMVFFPLFTMLLLKGLGFLKSFKMESTKDRIVPLMATMIFYFWASHVFNNIPSPNLIKILLMGCFWGTIVLFMLNIFVKVSLHTSAAGGAVAMLLIMMPGNFTNMLLPLGMALVVSALIGKVRLLCKAHTPAEVWLGFITGIIVQLAAYAYMR
jgi:hypothetical protein